MVAASAGNHAQGVALAAQELGITATIFMPLGVPVPKLLATRGYGAEVVLEGADVDETLRGRRRVRRAHGRRAHPAVRPPRHHRRPGHARSRDPRPVPDVETVVVPIGGGGLIAGVASAVEAQARRGRPHGAHRRRAGRERGRLPAVARGGAAGRRSRRRRRSPTASPSARPGCLELRRSSGTPSTRSSRSRDDDIARALLVLLERAKLVVEPAGAVGVAAILTGAGRGDWRRPSSS